MKTAYINPDKNKSCRSARHAKKYRKNADSLLDRLSSIATTMSPEMGGGSKETTDADLKEIFQIMSKSLKSHNEIGRVESKAAEESCEELPPRFGTKPVHTPWFGPPPKASDPHFGTDTLAASVYAVKLQNDPEASIHFWCLNEYKQEYEAYYSQHNLAVVVHTQDELIRDFEEIENVKARLTALEEKLGANHTAVNKIRDLLNDYKMAIYEKKGLFLGEINNRLNKADKQQYLSACLSIIWDYINHPGRRSARDYVTLKDHFVAFLLIIHGGYCFDATVIPQGNEFNLPNPTDFAPVVAINPKKMPEWSLQRDIFALSTAIGRPSLLVNSMSESILKHIQRFFHPYGLAIRFPKVDASGKKSYSRTADFSDDLISDLCIYFQAPTKITRQWFSSKTKSAVEIATRYFLETQPDTHGISSCVRMVEKSSHIMQFLLHQQAFNKLFLATHKTPEKMYHGGNKKSIIDACATALGETASKWLNNRKRWLLKKEASTFLAAAKSDPPLCSQTDNPNSRTTSDAMNLQIIVSDEAELANA